MSDQAADPKLRQEPIEKPKHRHWAAESETFAPVEVLLNYMRDGWELDALAAIEAYYYAGNRFVEILYFTLRRDGESIEMPVQSNPVARRLIQERGMTVIRVNVNRDMH